MRQIGSRSLWIGNAGDLRNARSVLALGIEAVVELADSEPPATLPRDLVHCRFPLSDGGNNPIWLLRLAVRTVAQLIAAEIPTAVCCNYGMNRSLCVTAAALALCKKHALDEALKLAAEGGPADINPELWEQLREAIVLSSY